MSTIVIVKKNGKAVIAADSRTTYGDMHCDATNDAFSEKILKANDAYIGIVGNSAHFNVFENLIEKYPSDLSFKNRKHIFLTALKLHRHLKEDYHIYTHDDERGQPYESSQVDSLIISPGGIYGLYVYRQVQEYTKFWAIGSGHKFALGAMQALYDRLEDAAAIAEAGVRAAAEFDNATAMPFSLYSVDLVAAK